MSDPRVTYRFGPLERRGLVGPFDLIQVCTVAAALVSAVMLLDLAPSTGGALLGLALVLIAVALATLPLSGRTPVQWVPVLATYLLRGLSGQRRFRSAAPRIGVLPGARAHPGGPLLPRDLRGIELLTLPYRSGTVGAIADRRGRALTAVLACEVGAFQLLDPPAQERQLAQWGTVLSACAGTPLRRLQWVERAAPAHGDELARWLHAERDPVLGQRDSPLMQSYLELIDAAAPVIHSHELLLAVQLDRSRVRGPASAAHTSLIEQTERIARALEAAEVKVLGALSAAQLANTLRTGFDPYSREELVRGELTAGRTADRTEREADADRRATAETGAPLASTEEWDHFRADGGLHCTFWIAGWPRVDVAPMFMSSLLNPSGVVRTVAVTFEPLAPDRSTRQVEAAVTRDRADRELRQRFGQGETARQRQAHEAALRREAELAAGHAEVRFSGFITVSGRDAGELRRACQETLQHAAVARLELRRMYGQQAEAFMFTLPLARGLS